MPKIEAGWLDSAQTFIPSLNFGNLFHNHDKDKALAQGSGPTPLTAEEVMAHPEYPHAYWKLKPDSSGRLEVAKGRGGPFKIAYEIHGHGPRKIVVCMRSKACTTTELFSSDRLM